MRGCFDDFHHRLALEHDLEGDGSGNRYAEFEIPIGQLLDLVGDFDVFKAFDLLAILDEADRHRIPKFRCELSAFHDEYLVYYVNLRFEQISYSLQSSQLVP